MNKIMKKVPFVSNTPDGMRCVPAVFKMLYNYFLDVDLSWDEIDRTLKVIPGKGNWDFPALTDLATKGVKIERIETVDYERLYREGPGYLKEIVGKESADYYLTKSNIASIIPQIPEYLKAVESRVGKGSVSEIIKNLNQGKIVTAEIDAKRLNKQPGFSPHYVLIYDFDEKNFTLHDPGLPPEEARKVRVEDFNKAFSFKGSIQGINIFG